MLVVLAVVLYESSQARGRPGVPDLTTNAAYAGHFAIYAAMVFCAMVAIGRASFLNLATVFVLAVCLGIAMELYQAFEPTRTASVQDAIANGAGAFFGVGTYAMASMLMEPSREPPRRQQPTEL